MAVSSPPPCHPQVSVVMAAHAAARGLADSLDSILMQHGVDLECLLIADGPLTPASSQMVQALQQRDPRLRVLQRHHGGLTRALIAGCEAAHGAYIARLDVGDAMESERLMRQVAILDQFQDCVLVTSDVAVCGPAWEPLWMNRCTSAMQAPERVDTLPPEQGLAMDIPHHASVLLRTAAYRAVGGYRPQFYFAQDWDLWYRLAQQGRFFHLPDVLTRVRLFSDGLSSRHWREQRRIFRLAQACYAARRAGESETNHLDQAATIRPASTSTAPSRLEARRPWLDGRRAEGAYFIAEALRRNRDRRCWPYFLEALRYGFWKLRIWVRAIQSLRLL